MHSGEKLAVDSRIVETDAQRAFIKIRDAYRDALVTGDTSTYRDYAGHILYGGPLGSLASQGTRIFTDQDLLDPRGQFGGSDFFYYGTRNALEAGQHGYQPG